MKVSRGKDGVQIRFSLNEARVFLELVSLYPRVPPAHYTLSRNGKAIPDAEAGQALLQEALAEQRAANRKSLLDALKDPARLKPGDHGGMTLKLGYPEAHCLLQVLNDLRVGSWVLLGSPENIDERKSGSNTEDYWVMDAAGFFESRIIDCLNTKAD